MYQTFLLINREWRDTDLVLSFLDDLIKTVSPQGALRLAAEVRDRSTHKVSRMSGDFYSLRKKLGKYLLDSVSLGSMEWRPDRSAEFYFFFEGERKVPGLGNKLSADRILTFSIGEETWKLAAKEGRDEQILSLVEQFFSATDCFYGFGHERETIISGPFDVLDLATDKPVRRIIDREWGEITDVYKYNYFSSSMLNKFKDSDALCRIDRVICKALMNSANETVGLAIYLQADEPGTFSGIAAECLRLIGSSGVQPAA